MRTFFLSFAITLAVGSVVLGAYIAHYNATNTRLTFNLNGQHIVDSSIDR